MTENKLVSMSRDKSPAGGCAIGQPRKIWSGDLHAS